MRNPHVKPLLVSKPLIHPIRDEVKKLTSRLRGLEDINKSPNDWKLEQVDPLPPAATGLFSRFNEDHPGQHIQREVDCPYGTIGDELWVRETWYAHYKNDDIAPWGLVTRTANYDVKIGYAADGERPDWAGKLRPSIHLPRKFSRYRLKITNIAVSRLHQISERDAELEGVERGIFRHGPNSEKREFHIELTCKGSPIGTYRDGFQYTWCTLHGLKSWELNPWVWRVYFNLIKPETS